MMDCTTSVTSTTRRITVMQNLLSILALLTTTTLLMFAAPTQVQAQDSTATTQQLERVENKYVCMVNDRAFANIQIPVPVGETTYYGCCLGCVSTLKNDATSRTATDPVTGKEVDKATAVVGALPDRTVLYFESEETMRQYVQQQKDDASSDS